MTLASLKNRCSESRVPLEWTRVTIAPNDEVSEITIVMGSQVEVLRSLGYRIEEMAGASVVMQKIV